MQALGKFNFKANVIPNGLEKCMSFSINNKLIFIDNFQFLSSLLDLDENNFNNLNREFDSNVLNLVEQKGFYHYEYMSDFEKFKEEMPSKENFYSSLTGKKISDNVFEHALKVWDRFKMKMIKGYHDLYLMLADIFEKFRSNSLQNVDYREAII